MATRCVVAGCDVALPWSMARGSPAPAAGSTDAKRLMNAAQQELLSGVTRPFHLCATSLKQVIVVVRNAIGSRILSQETTCVHAERLCASLAMYDMLVREVGAAESSVVDALRGVASDRFERAHFPDTWFSQSKGKRGSLNFKVGRSIHGSANMACNILPSAVVADRLTPNLLGHRRGGSKSEGSNSNDVNRHASIGSSNNGDNISGSGLTSRCRRR